MYVRYESMSLMEARAYRRWKMKSFSSHLFAGTFECHDRNAKRDTEEGRQGSAETMTYVQRSCQLAMLFAIDIG
jgi:hypothetical protein